MFEKRKRKNHKYLRTFNNSIFDTLKNLAMDLASYEYFPLIVSATLNEG